MAGRMAVRMARTAAPAAANTGATAAYSGRGRQRAVALMLCGTLVLAGCGRLSNTVANPMNWFGRSSSTEIVQATGVANPLIPAPRLGSRPRVGYQGRVVDQVATLRIERRPGGEVILASGVTSVIGYFDARLVAENDGEPVNGVLSYELKAVPPSQTVGVGTQRARTITVAQAVTDQDLAGVRAIVVKAAQNQRTVRR